MFVQRRTEQARVEAEDRESDAIARREKASTLEANERAHARSKATRAARAREVADPSVFLERRTPPIVGNVENLVTSHETADA